MNRIALALPISAAVMLSACGGSSNRLSATAYRTQLAAIDRQDSKVHATVDGLPHARSVAEMKAGLAAFAAGEKRLGAEVAGLEPPKNAEQANAALAKGLTDSGSEMKRVQAAIAAAKTPRQALQIIGKLGPQMRGGKELDSALAQLKKLGYTNGG